jgi:hypothetical protein
LKIPPKSPNYAILEKMSLFSCSMRIFSGLIDVLKTPPNFTDILRYHAWKNTREERGPYSGKSKGKFLHVSCLYTLSKFPTGKFRYQAWEKTREVREHYSDKSMVKFPW